MSELVLRAAGADEDVAIASCIAGAFPDNPKADVDVLRWQYRANPFGETASWVWDDDGAIVGHYSGYPVRCLLDGVPSMAANAVDAAVLPSYAGRGLFTKLAHALYADCASRGMTVSYCFGSNPAALHAVGNAGWREVARLRTLVLPVDDGWVASRFHVPRAAAAAARRVVFGARRGPTATPSTHVPEGIDDLWRRMVVAGGIRNGTIRDDAWFRWRYEASPTTRYSYVEVRDGDRLDAVAVVLTHEAFGGRFAYLMELLAAEPSSASAALRGVVATTPGIHGVATLAVGGSQLHRLATGAGMRTLPRRLEPKPARFGFVDNAGGLGHLVDAPWHVGWGDLDQL